MPDASIRQIKVTLKHIAPPIWRRIQVPSDIDLADLHDTLQIAMGWTDSHMHAFRIGPDSYGISDDMRDEQGAPLDRIAAAGDTIFYEYDFGDSWEHELIIEEAMAAEAGACYPRCIAGERACPPEDCGGVWGYENMLQILRDPKHEEYEETCEWMGEDFDPEAFDRDQVNGGLNELFTDDTDQLLDEYSLPTYPDEALAGLDELALIGRLRRLGDRGPRKLIDACAARAEAMVLALQNVLAAPRFWTDDIDDGSWWLRQHAAMILGLIATESAGSLLVELMRRLDIEDDESTQEWLGEAWPALFANKPASVARELQCLAEDREHDWYSRSFAAETYLSFALREGENALEAALDWAADLAADEDEAWDLRLSLGALLLEFPRQRHRALLDSVAARQSGVGVWFDAREVELAYARGHDQPDWERFANPWAFYDPDAIAARQARWAKEDEDPERDRESPPAWHEPYVRPERKIGRNDPCPCGSGKKYKKCCLGKLH